MMKVFLKNKVNIMVGNNPSANGVDDSGLRGPYDCSSNTLEHWG